MINVIILNGPSGVGKDTIAEAIKEQGEGKIAHLRFKSQLYLEAFDLFNGFYGKYRKDEISLTCGEFIELCTDRKAKDIPHAALFGFTPRQVLIFTSEVVVKPILGGDHYGAATAERTSVALDGFGNEMAVLSDGGFKEELVPMCERFNVMLVRLHRDGFTFNGDSRGYIYGAGSLPDKVIDIHLEEGNVQFAVDEIMAAAQ